MSLPPLTGREARPSGSNTATSATAVINAKMIHKIMVLFQNRESGEAAAKRRAVAPSRYITTASLRRQWEHQRDNCALLRRGFEASSGYARADLRSAAAV